MGKILILYYSKGGNTKKMAEHVLEGVQQIPDHEVRFRSVAEAKQDDLVWCAFSSQGGWGGGAELTCQALGNIMMNYGLLVFGVSDYVAHQYSAHYGTIQAGEPRLDKEKDACRLLGKRLAEWVAVYVDGRKELHPLKGHYKRNPWD